jgi:hypothetical protein
MEKTSTNKDNEANNSSLKIGKKDKAPLSKNQQAFNRLTAKIEKLEKEIIAETAKLENISKNYRSKLNPVKKEIANEKIKLAQTLAQESDKYKFSKNQKEDINEVILDLCSEAFKSTIPTPEQEAFYNSRSDISYKEELEEQEKSEKELFKIFMKGMFGKDINDFENEEEFFSNMKEKFNAQTEGQTNSKRKKTKKQVEDENRLKEEEAMKTKSLRSIYIALVKILHPDKETDIALKAEKEELMKKVVLAYEKKDLPALLKLEMEFVHKQTEYLDQLSDEKLQFYIAALQEQAEELQGEKNNLSQHPRFADIIDYTYSTEKEALKDISHNTRRLTSFLKQVKLIVMQLVNKSTKKEILNFVDNYFADDDDDDDFDDDDLLDMLYGFR